MPGPPPNKTRRRANRPRSGDWQQADSPGWQHGAIPKPPSPLTPAARTAWRTWFGAWFAAYWTPDNLPQLRKVIQLYDEHERGRPVVAELRNWMDGMGITPLGQQRLHWLPVEETTAKKKTTAKLPRLRVINE